MLSIGMFSKLSGVSANALRYYDETGLLKPTAVNEESGYRYYTAAQLRTVLLIGRLKSYGLSLDEIGDVLQDPQAGQQDPEAGRKPPADSGALLALMREKYLRVRRELYRMQYAAEQMQQDILNLERGRNIMAYLDNMNVELVETKDQTILYVREKMSTQDYMKHLTGLLERAKRDNLTLLGAPITIFHHEEEFDPDCYDNEIAIPVKEAVAGTRVLPGGKCAKITLHGPYTELRAAYAKLQQWVEQEGYRPIDDAYEVYVTDPHEVKPEENVTEVYLPVGK